MKRAIWRMSVIKAQAKEKGGKKGMVKLLLARTRGVLTALRSHMGQRREYPRQFALPENQHLAVVRLRSPGEAQRWLKRVTKQI
jgi:hypothetical protein